MDITTTATPRGSYADPLLRCIRSITGRAVAIVPAVAGVIGFPLILAALTMAVFG